MGRGVVDPHGFSAATVPTVLLPRLYPWSHAGAGEEEGENI